MENNEKKINISFPLVAAILLAFITTTCNQKGNSETEPSEKIGMIESMDGGATWIFRGHASIPGSTLIPVDPSAMWDENMTVFYFFDLGSLGKETAIMYRSVADDDSGLNFIPPEFALEYQGDFTDPFVLKLPGGMYRVYFQSHTENAIISATSPDGHFFTLDSGIRSTSGGVPGALLLPDGKVRLFVCETGITSLISEDGLNFTQENGVRIPIPEGAYIVADPDPIRASDGRYLMAYKLRPENTEEPFDDQIYLAESMDGFTWTTRPGSLYTGSVPTLVELPDGRLRIYFVDFSGE